MPEFQISHDDYTILCKIMQDNFQYILKQHCHYYALEIPSTMMLPESARYGVYKPMQIVYLEEFLDKRLDVSRLNDQLSQVRLEFPKRKRTEKSLFRYLMNPTLYRNFLSELYHFMMPIIANRTEAPIYTALYAMSTSVFKNDNPHRQDVASYTPRNANELHYICKSIKLLFKITESCAVNVYWLLKLNARHFLHFQTNNDAIQKWFDRFSRQGFSVPEGFFHDLQETLLFEHTNLVEDPIKTIMQYREGYYFLPVFYALCNHYQTPSKTIAEQLMPLVDPEYHPLLRKLAGIHPESIQFGEMSLNTLHFCANNLNPKPLKSNREKVEWIVQNNRRAILSVTTSDQMLELMRSLQKRHLPIYVFKLKNALKKPCRYIWNSLMETWQEVSNDREISEHMETLWTSIKRCYADLRAAGEWGGPNEEIVTGFSIKALVSTIVSDATMERKDILLDAHKWLLRLHDGVLDLLTGHIGGVVPEFFISERKMSLGIPRPQMMVLCNQSPHLERLYDRLVHKTFFQKYLQVLCLDHEPTVLDALKSIVEEADPIAQSMLQFYANLCKFTCFQYDLLLYLLDVLASVFIGTNYMRKFFVFKGKTRNGKSKLFELMGSVLGGYYYSIQSENLIPGHSPNTATPELASTLFSCRMVASEELEKRLNENRVKQLTGNSFVTFRNLYEQNTGGIPIAKIFVTTNNYPECQATEAFKDRVLALPFEAEFSDTPAAKTSEQIACNVFPKESHVVPLSTKGCFFMLYYHLQKGMDPSDGLLHYRKTPEAVVDYTRDYLTNADIYAQFKSHMDVQIYSGYSTTYADVQSAVRQYLKSIKNTSDHESQLIAAFEAEFRDFKKTDVQFSLCSFDYVALGGDEDGEEGGSSKRAKMMNETLIFYEGVVIRNLKRHNLE